MANVHYRACNLCEAMCGVKIEFEGTKVLSIRGDQDDPFSKGHLCPKATALQSLYEDPDRLRHPMRRVGDQWQKLSWDDALDAAEQMLRAVSAGMPPAQARCLHLMSHHWQQASS